MIIFECSQKFLSAGLSNRHSNKESNSKSNKKNSKSKNYIVLAIGWALCAPKPSLSTAIGMHGINDYVVETIFLLQDSGKSVVAKEVLLPSLEDIDSE